MKHILRIEKKIFDGKDDDFYELEYRLRCPCCGSDIVFDNAKSKSAWQLQRFIVNQAAKYINNIKIIDEPDDEFPNYIYEDLSIYYQLLNCHEKQLIIFIAEGEIQPARYQIYLLGIFELSKELLN
ncbi:hypothetical protein [Xenorhabdus szentirmaii]|uniref:hypothetical protein n=1 Tax=Xenorhabdus szentirmaii TaxID=290112 RepID=UPI0019B1B95B|nr:hypothetical protein [Xenorhabdus sp. 38]MBD2779393.1 hypothetical protein [Xenorhabdus sp. 38]